MIHKCAQSEWFEDLQSLGYKDPLPIPTHVGMQAILAMMEGPKIHSFIQEHDRLAMEDSKKEDNPLILEMLGPKEFCDTTFMVYQEEQTIVIDKLKILAKELPEMLE